MRALFPTLLLLALLAPPVSARGEWYDYYDNALAALDRGDPATAVGLIEAALERKDRSGYLRTYGNNYIRYVPHFQLGVALAGTGDCAAALVSWNRSETRGETDDVPDLGARLQHLRDECEIRLAPPAVEPVDTIRAEPAKRPAIDRTLLERGLAAYLEGDFAGAIGSFERLTQASPDSARLRLLLGMSLHGAWVTGGEMDPDLIERTRTELVGAAGLDAALMPDPALCPPRVAALFRSLR